MCECYAFSYTEWSIRVVRCVNFQVSGYPYELMRIYNTVSIEIIGTKLIHDVERYVIVSGDSTVPVETKKEFFFL